MDVSSLRYLKAVVDTGSVTRGAAVLHITPGALSKSIKRLERALGEPLLVPDGRGIRVTDHARQVVRFAQPVIAAHDEMLQRLDLLETEERRASAPLRIATSELFSTHVLGRLDARDLRAARLELVERGPGAIEQALVEGLADIGITTIPTASASIRAERLGRISVSVWGLERFRERDLAELPFIVPDATLQGEATRARQVDGWTADLPPRRVAARVTLRESALALCRIGLGVALLPDILAEAQNRMLLPRRRLHRVEASRLLGDASWQEIFVLHRAGERDTTPEWLVDALGALAQ